MNCTHNRNQSRNICGRFVDHENNVSSLFANIAYPFRKDVCADVFVRMYEMQFGKELWKKWTFELWRKKKKSRRTNERQRKQNEQWKELEWKLQCKRKTRIEKNNPFSKSYDVNYRAFIHVLPRKNVLNQISLKETPFCTCSSIVRIQTPWVASSWVSERENRGVGD